MFFSTGALAEYVTEHNKEIKWLGIRGYSAYFGIIGNFARSCNYNNIYFDISTNFGKAAYAHALSSKSRGVDLYRIDYEYDTSGNGCQLKLVEIRD